MQCNTLKVTLMVTSPIPTGMARPIPRHHRSLAEDTSINCHLHLLATILWAILAMLNLLYLGTEATTMSTPTSTTAAIPTPTTTLEGQTQSKTLKVMVMEASPIPRSMASPIPRGMASPITQSKANPITQSMESPFMLTMASLFTLTMASPITLLMESLEMARISRSVIGLYIYLHVGLHRYLYAHSCSKNRT